MMIPCSVSVGFSIPVTLLNISDKFKNVHKGAMIGNLVDIYEAEMETVSWKDQRASKRRVKADATSGFKSLSDHVLPLYQRTTEHLNDSQAEVLADILPEYSDLFSSYDLGF